MKSIIAAFYLVLILTLSGCVTETVNVEAGPPTYIDYSPGYTGYTQGYDGYGNYNDGYGPSFWGARYYFYSGYNKAYPGTR